MTTSSEAAAALDPLRFPLRGSSLIEASAGTGKTFTIAMLYVRLVLGHAGTGGHGGGEDAKDIRALTPPEILVVTFTDAATKELRERIRARLVDAAGYFRADPDEVEIEAAALSTGADLLHDLRAEYAPEHWPGCARRLQLAAEWMDEAAVSTIHGWCNRMLSEHAFDSDSLFSQTLETDQSALQAEVVRDYWRTFLTPLDAESAHDVRQWFASPLDLQRVVSRLLAHADLLPQADAPESTLKEARDKQRAHLARLKENWTSWCDELQTILDEARDKKQFNAQKLNRANCQTWLEKLRAWAADPLMARPAFDDKAAVWTRLTHAGLAEIWKVGEPPSHPALDAMEALRDALAAQPTAYYDLLCHAAHWVSQRFAAEEKKRSQMGFDDLLTRLRDALRSPNGERLADIIRKQYPVALIDEFQDTDPIQYEIFDRVYRIKENHADTAIILIGDPKQAIYAFRGADIYTYLAARRACAGRLFTLKKNFRSTRAMVSAVNRCFEAAEERPAGPGAFLFRDSETGDNPLPFVAAEAAGRRDTLRIADGDSPAALTAWWMPPMESGIALSKDAYMRGMAAGCASEMVRLLNLGQAKKAGFVSDSAGAGAGAKDGAVGGTLGLKPLQPADMAVLVNNGEEARAIRTALAERGVRSVYLSDRDSVFQTEQAVELRHWLAACAEPDDGRLVRAALATATLGLDFTDLDALTHDEIAWETRVMQFRGYRDSWRNKGVLPMLRQLLHDFQVPQRLIGRTAGAPVNGERVLTNLLHLAELLQQASTQLDGEHALIRYVDEELADQAGGGAGGDARQLRLESDAGLVQVVTIHKSKGLEYPLVFLPFAGNYRPAKAADMPLKWHDDEGRLKVTLDDVSVLPQVDRERLGEDLRKLYVALTRARYATWVGIAPIPGIELSAFGYLLSGGRAIVPDELGQLLEQLRLDHADICVAEAPAAGSELFASRESLAERGAARTLSRAVREHWWIASYSSLRKVDGVIGGVSAHEPAVSPLAAAGTGEQHPAPDTRGQDVYQELAGAETPDDFADAAAAWQRTEAAGDYADVQVDSSLHGLPRGADAGTFIHELMEWAATEGFAEIVKNREMVRDTVARRCSVRGWARWIEPLTEWLLRLLREPLRIPSMSKTVIAPVTLSALETYVPEMEFWVATHDVDAQTLDRLVCDMTLDGAVRPALEPAQLNGMLKGFIDLVFEHDGRFYVADYKSNWLGPDDAAYTTAKMRAQILHSRYELQYVLYLFALHRLLKTRLPDYDYDRHVGGAVYLFLRGSHAESQGVFVDRPPRELIERLDALFANSVGREELAGDIA
ncbi:exodeoxyribonuclease V subunit beta [Paraburkholderia edwinii]|uniref:RecBCD enzyme subunit RecB n=1 Tax=Paraburkholderia edwinii TaxID=2861782 RepID=A0ABX8UKZ6_9BURK|nr:exodeoxyribonuclease V subunit beta [Paraburkholderia edwinii]QYD69007.1 exodeoxyribonuclease V subunit beta [Paraburkholderia edwinii]